MSNRSEYAVCINLTRLLEASKGSGGAGWFGIEACIALAQTCRVTVLVTATNSEYIRKSLGDRISANLIVELVEGSLEDWLAKPVHGLFDAYMDPLNGLEPARIPSHIASIAVIHDLMFEREPQVFSQNEIDFRTHHYFDAIRRSDLTLTVAQREVCDITRLFPGKAVRYVDQPAYFVGEAPTARPKNRPVVLFSPGVQWNHKNHFRLVSAFLHLLEQGRIDPATRLCLSAILPIEANHLLLKPLIENSSHGDAIIQMPFLSRSRFVSFMERCDGLVLPSIHEGYGIPLIEAVASGRPILTTRIPSLDVLAEVPESVRLIERPKDIASIADALEAFIRDLPVAKPQPELCPSFDVFADQLAQAVREAVSARRNRENPSPMPITKIKRRKNELSIFAVGEPGSTIGDVGGDVKLFGLSGPAPSGASVACPTQDPQTLSLHLTHELILSESRFVLLANACDLGRLDSAAINQAMVRLASSKGKARIRGVDLGLPSTLSIGNGLLPAPGIYDLNHLDLHFEATPQEVLAMLDQAETLYGFGATRALILDPSLKNPNGHHLGVAVTLARSLKAQGYHTSVACNIGMTLHAIEGADQTLPALSDYLYEQNGDIGLARSEFANAFHVTGITGGDVVFAFCATPTMLAALMLELARRKQEQRPLIVIRFDRPQWRTPPTSVGYDEVFAMIRALGLRKHFSFTVESEGLQRCFELSSGERMPIRLNYVAPPENTVDSLIGAEVESDDSVIVSFVGEAREEKGFQLLPDILESVTARLTDTQVQFRIQCGANVWNQTRPIKDALDRLRTMAREDSRIALLDGALPEDEYLHLIRSGDIVFLPYDPPQYRIRGSGVATEAAAYGVEMVVSHALDIVGTYPEAIVTASRNYSVEALAEALLERIRAVAAKSPAERAQSRKLGSGDLAGFAKSFIVPPPADMTDESQLVIWIANDTRGEGSESVYRSQLEFLHERGYFVIQLVAPYPARWRLDHPWQFDASKFVRDQEIVLNFRHGQAIEQVFHSLEHGGDVLANFTAAWGEIEVPGLIKKIIENCRPKFAVVNYAHHRPIISRLVKDSIPMILETHDIQALQYAIQQDRPVDEAQIAKEMELVASFDQIVSISKSEAVIFADHCGTAKTHWCMPYVSAPTAHAAKDSQYDLLFVGSGHHANLVSLHWFIDRVYGPLLHPQGLTLAVVGDAGGHVDADRFGGAVTCPGRVPALDEWYDKSAVVVLPVVAGAGVPIKVIDAMTRAMPFVLTDFPAKAMDLPPEIPLARTPMQFAEQVLALLSDQAERQRRAEQGAAFAKAKASREHYFKVWDKVLNGALAKQAKS